MYGAEQKETHAEVTYPPDADAETPIPQSIMLSVLRCHNNNIPAPDYCVTMFLFHLNSLGPARVVIYSFALPFHDSEYPDASSPSVALRRNNNLVGKGVRVICSNWGNMVFPQAGRRDDLENRFL